MDVPALSKGTNGGFEGRVFALEASGMASLRRRWAHRAVEAAERCGLREAGGWSGMVVNINERTRLIHVPY